MKRERDEEPCSAPSCDGSVGSSGSGGCPAAARCRFQSASEAKAKGNGCFKRGRWQEAADAYGFAIELSTEADASRKVYYSNRAAARIMLGEAGSALADGDQAVRLDGEWWKGHFRRARALMLLPDTSCSEVVAALDAAETRGGGQEVMLARKIWELHEAGEVCFQQIVDDVMSIFLADNLQEWLHRVCEPHAALAEGVARTVPERLLRRGGLAVAELMREGVNFDEAVHEEAGKGVYRDWMLEKLADWHGRPVSLRMALAAKVADTHCVDTIADPPRALKRLSGFSALSKALDEQFRIEDSLTSGFNDDYGCWKVYGDLPGCRRQQTIRDLMGPESGVKARRGVGSRFSKELIKKDREVFRLGDSSMAVVDVPGKGFPYHHKHPMFRDNDSVEALCEPFSLQLRGPGDRNATYKEKWAKVGTSTATLGIQGEEQVGPDLWAPTGDRWHFLPLAGGAPLKTALLLCFRLLDTVSASSEQAACNVEIMTVKVADKQVQPLIMASKDLDPKDELCLWLPGSPLELTDRQGEGDGMTLSFWHPLCKLSTQSQHAMQGLMGADGSLDDEKVKQFAEFMKASMAAGQSAGLKGPPGGPECPTQ